MRKLVITLLGFLALVLLPATIVKAADFSGGLLDGKTLNVNNGGFADATSTNTKLLTDNDETTIFELKPSINNAKSATYTFETSATITHYFIGQPDAINTPYITMYDANGVKLHGASKVANAKTQFPTPITGVKKVVFAALGGGSNLKLTEVNVYGSSNDPVSDTTPPPVPTGLIGTPGNGQVELSWTPVSASDLSGYHVYQDGNLLNVTVQTAHTRLISGLTNGVTYSFEITAKDISGNESEKSTSVTVTPVAPADTTPPKQPTGFIATESGSNALLSWTANTESDLAGYNVYKDGVKQNGSPITATSFTATSLTKGQSYTFGLSAVDTSGNESTKATVTFLLPDTLSVNLVPNMDSIVIQVTGGAPPYTVSWDSGTDTFNANKYTIMGLMPQTEYTVTVTDENGTVYTRTINTGNLKAFDPPVMPDPVSLFQKMIDVFGKAGWFALYAIGGAVSLAAIVFLALFGWRLSKRWLSVAK